MTATLTTQSAILKEYYIQKRVMDMVYKLNPFLARVKKVEKFGGGGIPIPFIAANPRGGSRDFAKAQSRATATSTTPNRVLLSAVQDYQLCRLDGKFLRQTKDDMSAFLKGATTEIDGTINALKRSIAVKLFRSGYGSMTQIATGTGGSGASTFTCSPTDDVTNFEVGDVVVFASTESSAALRASGATLAVTGVNRSTGVITLSAAVTSITSVTAGDFIFRWGDRQDSATPSRLAIAGLEAWNPQTAPTSGDSFFGLDRSADPNRNAGQRKDFTGQPIEEALIEGAAIVHREGGELTDYYLNAANWAKLQKALTGRLIYTDLPVTAKVGFKAIQIVGPTGPINVVADFNCPNNRIFGVNHDHLTLYSAGPAVQPLEEDGLMMLRVSDDDAYEVRYMFLGNLATEAPAYAMNIAI